MAGKESVAPVSKAVVVSALLAVLVLGIFLSLSLGASRAINFKTVLPYLFAGDNSKGNLVVTFVRLPRTIIAMLTGGNLAVAGALMQGATRNRLASPGIFGVTAGASVVISLWLALSPEQGAFTLVALSFMGAAAGGLLVLFVGGALSGGSNMVRMALTGVAISAVLASLTQAIVILDENSADKVLFWLAGSVHQSNWDDVKTIFPWTIAGCLIAAAVSFPLDSLALGDGVAKGLGRHPSQIRVASFVAVIVLTGAAVAIAGPISFLGLIVPHMARRLVGTSHKILVPVSFLLGAALMVHADCLSRLIRFPYETPSGVLTAVVGGPFFLYVARKENLRRAILGEYLISANGQPKNEIRKLVILFIATLFVSLASHAIGAVSFGAKELFAWIGGSSESMAGIILSRFRAPRITTALLAGGAMAISGTLIQAVIRNPLAAPETIGISRGASLAVVSLFMILGVVSTVTISVIALVGGLFAGEITYILAYNRGVSGPRLALVGLAVSTIAASVVTLLLATYPQDLNVALLWLTGSLWGRQWTDALGLLPWVAILFPVAFALATHLDVLALGDEIATSLGERVETLRLGSLLIAVALSSSSVAAVGAISFVGLMAPHVARLLVGQRHRLLIPAAAAVGAIVLVLADTAGRGLLPPVEIPAGIITAVFGGLYFIYLLYKAK